MYVVYVAFRKVGSHKYSQTNQSYALFTMCVYIYTTFRLCLHSFHGVIWCETLVQFYPTSINLYTSCNTDAQWIPIHMPFFEWRKETNKQMCETITKWSIWIGSFSRVFLNIRHIFVVTHNGNVCVIRQRKETKLWNNNKNVDK